MHIQGIPIEQVYDFVAFRVIVDKPADCWQVLGLVHNLWTPIPSRFKDFINVPKPNGYRSLHTSVIGPLGERMEVQIRTWQMHRDAESGIAAHWSYKESGRMEVRDQERFSFMKQLVEWAQEIQAGGEGESGILDEVRENLLFEDQVFVFTPQGDLRVLRQGATALDFAYEVHTQIGHACNGVRVNGRLVPLATELVSGDVVEVMTSRTARPRRDWLNFAVTSRARSKIKSWLLEEERREALEIGHQMLEKEFRKAGPLVLRHMKDFFGDEGMGRRIAEAFRIGSRDELIRAVGHGKIEALDVVRAVVPPAPVEAAQPELPKVDQIPKRLQGPTGIVVDGINGMLLHMARCCNPIPGDRIVGYVTRARGVTIHNASCQSVLDADPERLLPAQWNSGIGGTFNVPLRLLVDDVPGVLAGVTAEITKHDANIAGVGTRRLDGSRHQVDLVVQVEDQKKLDAIMRSLRRVKGVAMVERVRQAGAVKS
jgi:GTP pyrophosphokinase